MPRFVILPGAAKLTAKELQAIAAKSSGEHARRGGFPADCVNEVAAVIDPVTADAGA